MSSQVEKKPVFLQPGGRIVRFEKSHANDLGVIEMRRLAQERLKKTGFPKELLDKTKSR